MAVDPLELVFSLDSRSEPVFSGFPVSAHEFIHGSWRLLILLNSILPPQVTDLLDRLPQEIRQPARLQADDNVHGQ